jgi:hypothetical protein
MKVPEVRTRLRELAVEHGIDELEVLADNLRRRPAVRRAPVQSASMTRSLAAAIKAYAAAYPTASLSQIAAVFAVNHGRVSEVLAGKRS